MIEYSRKSYSNLVEHLKTLSHQELLEYVEVVAENQKEAEKAHRKAQKDIQTAIDLRNVQKENEFLKAENERLNYKMEYNLLGDWIKKQFENDSELFSLTISRKQITRGQLK